MNVIMKWFLCSIMLVKKIAIIAETCIVATFIPNMNDKRKYFIVQIIANAYTYMIVYFLNKIFPKLFQVQIKFTMFSYQILTTKLRIITEFFFIQGFESYKKFSNTLMHSKTYNLLIYVLYVSFMQTLLFVCISYFKQIVKNVLKSYIKNVPVFFRSIKNILYFSKGPGQKERKWKR